MTLKEMSRCYREAAVPLRQRLKLLRQMLAQADDPEEVWRIKRRIAELTPLLTQMNDWFLNQPVLEFLMLVDKDTKDGIL